MLKKKNWANFQRIIEVFTQKFSLSSQKYGVGIRDPRSGIRKNLFRIPDPEVKKAPDPRSAPLANYILVVTIVLDYMHTASVLS